MDILELMYLKMDEYQETFGECYPLMREADPDKVINYINQALAEGRSLGELFPDKFGAAEGIEI